MGSTSRCWCGRQELRPFGEGYLECPACGTLIRAEIPDGLTRVRDDERDFYGRAYWFDHQKTLGQLDLMERCATDFTGRALHWLRTILAYQPPPARVLEIGAAHGGLVALLRWAGYDATGLELSPWVVDFARRTFGVPMLLGPIEDQTIEANLDLIVVLDTLEHLPDPVGTLEHCAGLLADDGLLLVQTPCRPARTLREMHDGGDRFVEMLLPEHLHLFSRAGVEQLCLRTGMAETRFEPAIFPYDMYFVAGRQPPIRLDDDAARRGLPDEPVCQLIEALLDLATRDAELDNEYHRADEDRVQRQEQILELHRLLEGEQQGRAQDLERQAAQVSELNERLEAQEKERAELNERLEAQEGERAELNERLEAQDREREKERVRQRAIRRWGRRIDSAQVWDFPTRLSVDRREETSRRSLAVDLTALLPGGQNGGAKWVATTLVRSSARLAPETDFLLLTSEACHPELVGLEAPNVRCRLTRPEANGFSEILDEESARLLFCPMTAPPFVEPRVPLVCLIHDLQYLTLPRFFDDHERSQRDQAFRRALRFADRIVTVSEYVRGTVLARGPDYGFSLDPARVTTIHNGPGDHLSAYLENDGTSTDEILRQNGLERDRYLLYPANFWPHKNHLLLLTAFSQYCHRIGPEGLKLVLTGAERPDPEPILGAIRRMGLGDSVRMLGFLPSPDFAALVSGCRALVFPSLYEGFGMPVIEAMSCGRPVLCSDRTSLPEVAGDAALLFDPRRPAEIADAMVRITRDQGLIEDSSRRGRDRAAGLGGADRMARAYLDVFEEVVSTPRRFSDSLTGVWADGWTGRRFTIGYAEAATLGLGLSNPREESVVVTATSLEKIESATIPPRSELHLRCHLAESGCLELAVRPTLCSAAHGSDSDLRHRGLKLEGCTLRRPSGNLDLLAKHDD